MARRPGKAVLRATYWGNDTDRDMAIECDGRQITVERRLGPKRDDWVIADYPLPSSDQARSRFRLVGLKGTSVVYGLDLIEPPSRRA